MSGQRDREARVGGAGGGQGGGQGGGAGGAPQAPQSAFSHLHGLPSQVPPPNRWATGAPITPPPCAALCLAPRLVSHLSVFQEHTAVTAPRTPASSTITLRLFPYLRLARGLVCRMLLYSELHFSFRPVSLACELFKTH